MVHVLYDKRLEIGQHLLVGDETGVLLYFLENDYLFQVAEGRLGDPVYDFKGGFAKGEQVFILYERDDLFLQGGVIQKVCLRVQLHEGFLYVVQGHLVIVLLMGQTFDG